MSQVSRVRLQHERPTLDGVLTFDGDVVEIFGFNDVHSVRLPLELIEGANASFKDGLLAQPTITFPGRGGGLGYSRAIEPPEVQQAEIEEFCAAVTRAAELKGGLS